MFEQKKKGGVKNRLLQVNELIKRELGDLVLHELDIPENTLVTVTRVETTGNLQQAKVYISVMPEEYREKALFHLGKHVYRFQQQLNKRLKMRPVPRVQFIQEKKSGEAQRIEELLEKIKKE